MSLSKVVLLYSSSSLSYTLDMYQSLFGAFRQEGIDTIMLDADEGDDAVRQQLESLKPDFIFEINRTKNQSSQAIPAEIPHIAWIHDAWRECRRHGSKQLHYADPLFGGSDLTYTLIQPDYFGFSHHLQHGIWGRLHTGIDPLTNYPSAHDQTVPNSAAICGYIPLPLYAMSRDIVSHALASCHGKKLHVGRIADFLSNKAQASVCQHTTRQVHELIADLISKLLEQPCDADLLAHALGRSALLQLLDTEIPRTNARLALGNLAVNAGLDLSIYGLEQWLQWPQFAPLYRRNLHKRQDLAEVYRQTQFNLHNGCFGMHSRVLEGMGCGSAMFVYTGRFDDTEYDIKRYFVPGEHYIPLSTEDGVETLRYWRDRRPQLREIGLRAAEETLAHHTWRHRIQEILSDWESLQMAQPAT